MNVASIRKAQGEIDEAQEELLQWEARLAELEELLTEAAAAGADSASGHGDLLRERRLAEAELRSAFSRLGDAKRALVTLRMMRPRRSDGRHAA